MREIQRSRKLIEGLVEIIHLYKDTDHNDDGKDIGRRMSELI